ncbi:MAG: EamA family transporter [Candidatus Woesearchaeota archaeon]
MATALWAVGLTLIASFLGSLGPVFLKMGSMELKKDIKSIIFNYKLIIGIAFYGLGTVLFVPALKGGDLSVLYPLIATTYIWVSIYSIFMLKEKMNNKKWMGIVFIIIGVCLIGLGGL